MNKKIFISFDYDNDKDIKGCLSYQLSNLFNKKSKNNIIDASLKQPFDQKWKKNTRSIIGSCDLVIFLCGEHTESAAGVTAEMSITQELEIPYILLKGRKNKKIEKPKHSSKTDNIEKWSISSLKEIILNL